MKRMVVADFLKNGSWSSFGLQFPLFLPLAMPGKPDESWSAKFWRTTVFLLCAVIQFCILSPSLILPR